MILKVFDFLDGSNNYWINHGFKLVNNIKDCDILCLNGGADIGTEIYHETPVYGSGFGSYEHKSRRDQLEIDQYKEAKRMGKFIFGICRGAQLITCLEGGSLWQHVNKHFGNHPIKDQFTGEIYSTTSVHHQMMRPPKGVNYQVIASCARSDYRVSQHIIEEGLGDDPEIIWYPDCRALCVQGHPEYASKSAFADYCTDLIHHLWANPVWPPEKVASRVVV